VKGGVNTMFAGCIACLVAFIEIVLIAIFAILSYKDLKNEINH